jgi:hypothetical protein
MTVLFENSFSNLKTTLFYVVLGAMRLTSRTLRSSMVAEGYVQPIWG